MRNNDDDEKNELCALHTILPNELNEMLSMLENNDETDLCLPANGDSHDEESFLRDLLEYPEDIIGPQPKDGENELNLLNALNDENHLCENREMNDFVNEFLAQPYPIPIVDLIKQISQSHDLHVELNNRDRIRRERENNLRKRNVPHLLQFSSDYTPQKFKLIVIMLSNSPVFNREMLQLLCAIQDNEINLQLSQSTSSSRTNIQDKIDFVMELLNIVQKLFETYENNDGYLDSAKLFDIYRKLYSSDSDLMYDDVSEVYFRIMDVIQSVVDGTDQKVSHSKAFELKNHVDLNETEFQPNSKYVITVRSNASDFQQFSTESSAVARIESVIQQYHPQNNGRLPDQLFVDFPEQTYHSINDQWPIELKLFSNQNYLLNAVLIKVDPCFIGLFRQNSVYFNHMSRIIGPFPIESFQKYFTMECVSALLFVKVDRFHRYVCTYEDPLFDKAITDLMNEIPPIIIQWDNAITPNNTCGLIMKHPISTIMRYRMDSDYLGNNINKTISILPDCLDNNELLLRNRSLLSDEYLECTTVFTAPDRQFYFSHYRFVNDASDGIKFENPIYVKIDSKKTSNDEWFPLTFKISKGKQAALQSKGTQKNETDEDNQSDSACELRRFPDGEKEIIDQKKLASYKVDDCRKETRKRRLRKSSQRVTPLVLSKVIDIHKLQIVFRRAHYSDEEDRFIADSNILLVSNAFKAVNSKFKKIGYSYTWEQIKIEEISPLRIGYHNEVNKFTIDVTYTIPETYECTKLIDKFLQIKIISGTDETSEEHPLYQILDINGANHCKIFSVHNYYDKILLTIKKQTFDEYMKSKMQDQPTNRCTSPSEIDESSQTIYRALSISKFRIQIGLCHKEDETIIIYPRSVATSETIIDSVLLEQFNQEKLSGLRSSPTNCTENDVESSRTQLLSYKKNSANECTIDSSDEMSKKKSSRVV